MKIAELAPLWKKVPPEKYGGTELVVANVTNELVKLGHEVTLFACGGSETSANLVSAIDKPMYDLVGGFSWGAIQAYEFLQYQELFKRIKEFDVVHNHMGFHPAAFSELLPCPMVTTCHSSVKPDFPYLIPGVKGGNFVSISNAQRALVPELNYVETIYHGIDISLFTPNIGETEGYLLFIGSLTKNKGIDIAVQAAVDLGKKLIIAGEVRKEDEEFLKNEIFKHVDGKKISFVGEVNHEEKNKLYRNAEALLFPSQWVEAFGLVMAESLACGTPVIGFNKGSVPEVIENGVTGYVVENFEEFKEKIGKVKNISRDVCRKTAEKRFSAERMAKDYVKLFEKLISKTSK